MLGRPRESARLAQTALDVMRRYGIDSTGLVSNRIEALVAIGEWDEADTAQRRRAAQHHAELSRTCCSSSAPSVEIGRGDVRRGAGAPRGRARPCARTADSAIYDAYVAELALWERRWTDAEAAVRDGLARARRREAAQIRVWLCAKGLRAQAELAALARARRDADGVRERLRARRRTARRAPARPPPRPRRSRRTPPAGSPWPRPSTSAPGARGPTCGRPPRDVWDRLERPPLAAYCRWREAEALVAAGAPRAEATRAAERGPRRRRPGSGARRCCASSSCSPSARGSIRRRRTTGRRDAEPASRSSSGLTPREAEVLTLVARGLHQPRDRRRRS